MKLVFSLFSIFFCISIFSQAYINNKRLDQAQKKLAETFNEFHSNLVNQSYSKCIQKLLKSTSGSYENFLIAEELYFIDKETASQLHKKAYHKDKGNLMFQLAYANELHRSKKFDQAITIYNTYLERGNRITETHTWLSDCYIQLGNTARALEHWQKTKHSTNSDEISKAICRIYGTDKQNKQRNELQKRVIKGDTKAAFNLIYLDMNWEITWWKKKYREAFAKSDLILIKNIFGANSSTYDNLLAYTTIKSLADNYLNQDRINLIFRSSGLITQKGALVPNGKITADLIQIALRNNLIKESSFYQSHGKQLTSLVNKTKDDDLVNLYIYLETNYFGKPNSKLELKGWKEFNNKRCAASYLSEEKVTINDIHEAQKDFNHSATIQRILVDYKIKENLNYKSDLIKLIQLEFQSLESEPHRYTYNLNEYFRLLKTFQ